MDRQYLNAGNDHVETIQNVFAESYWKIIQIVNQRLSFTEGIVVFDYELQ